MNKFKNSKILSLFMAAILTNSASCLGTTITISTPNLGDYVNLKYISALEDGHSPLLAQRAHLDPQVISIDKKDDTLIVSEIINWHEGCTIGTIASNTPNTLTYGDCGDKNSIKIEDKNYIYLNDEKYKYVGESARFLSWMLLGGTYTDERGLSYRFDANGNATFPDQNFKYELCLDQVAPPCSGADIFYDKSNNKAYAFKIHGDNLSLYGVPDREEEDFDFKKPIITLRRK